MFLTILVFIAVLGLIVLVHELGHLLSARTLGIKVHEFGFGYPPRLFGFYKDESGRRRFVWGRRFKLETAPNTVWSLNWIPIGGFVKIKGEDGSGIEDKDSFAGQKAWKRSVVLSAGVLANFLLCFVLLSIGYGVGLPAVVDEGVLNNVKSIRDNQIQVVSINADSPGQTAGLRVGDAVLAIDGKPVANIAQIQDYTAQKNGLLMKITVKRDNQALDLEIIPRVLSTSNGKAVMGIGLARMAVVSYKWHAAVWQGLKNTVYLIGAIITALAVLVKNIITTGQVSAEVAGPVGIAALTGQVVQLGWIYVLQFTALLSVNLGIINILPFPALDGGRLLFVLIEKIRGREVNRQIENLVHTLGFALLMVLIILVTYHDLVRWGGKIIERVL